MHKYTHLYEITRVYPDINFKHSLGIYEIIQAYTIYVE